MFNGYKKIAIAVSGGADSLALVHMAKQWATDNNAKIVALTVDHNFREESAKEAWQVENWMNDLGIEHHTLTNPNPKPQSNLMAEARNIRYELLTQWSKDNDYDALAVAHHADDQIETFCINLERGSGVDGLSAIAPLSSYNDIKILRPLLSQSKSDLEQYLIERNIKWIEDPTNKNTIYKRNSIRALIAELDIAPKRLLDTVDSMARVRKALEYYTQQAVDSCCTTTPENHIVLSLEKFLKIPEEIQLRLLCQMLVNISGRSHRPRMTKLQNLLSSLSDHSSPFKSATLHNCKIRNNKNGGVVFLPEK